MCEVKKITGGKDSNKNTPMPRRQIWVGGGIKRLIDDRSGEEKGGQEKKHGGPTEPNGIAKEKSGKTSLTLQQGGREPKGVS